MACFFFKCISTEQRLIKQLKTHLIIHKENTKELTTVAVVYMYVIKTHVNLINFKP